MFPVCSPPRFEAPPVMYPLQMQCVSQPIQVPNPFAPVVYTSAAPSNMVLLNESPTRPPMCNQLFLSGNVQGIPQQLIPQQMVSPEPRFSPGAASPQVPPPAPYVNPQLPGSSFPLRIPSSQPSQPGQRITPNANLSSKGNLNRGFPLPATPYGFLDGIPQPSTCSSDTMLDGSKKEFMITRAEKVSLWRTFANVFHDGKVMELETTDNSLLAVFLGLPSHIRRAIRHQGGIGAFLKECPWFLVNGDKVVLVPCMEKLYTCQDDDVIENTEEEVKEGENGADVPDTWEDLSISDIEEGGYFGDYVPSEPETSDGESNQKCQSHAEDTKTSTEEITGETFLVGNEAKEKLMKGEKKLQQLESGRTEQMDFQKENREGHSDGGRKEKNFGKRSLNETGKTAMFVEDKDGKQRVWDGEGKYSENQQEVVREEKSPLSTTEFLSDYKELSQSGNVRVGDDKKASLMSSGNQSCQEIQQVVRKDNCGDELACAREILKEDTGGYFVDARGDSRVDSLVDKETGSFPTEIWDDSDDPDSDELKELFAKVDLGDGHNPEDRHESISARVGRDSEVDAIAGGRKVVTEGCFEQDQGKIQPAKVASKLSTTKDGGTSNSDEKKDGMIQTSVDTLKCNVQMDVNGLVVDDVKETGKDVASQTLDGICQPEPKKTLVDCSVDSCDLRPVQKTVSINTEPVVQKTASVNTDPVVEKKECSDRCKKMVASCRSDLQKAAAEQIDTEGRLSQTVSKLRQVERECHLLKEIHGSVIADLVREKQKPQMEEKSTSTDLSFDGDALKKLQKSLSEAKVKLLHGNLKNVDLQSKLALQLISQAYEESEIIFSMKKMSISKKASLTTQVMKYQGQLQSHKESVDEWKKKSETFLLAGGVIEKLPHFPQIDIEKFTPEVSAKGPLRHPSQPSAGDFRLAANFTVQPVTSTAPPYQTSSSMEATGRSSPLGGINQSKVSPMSTFTPNRKSDRPGTSVTFDGSSTFDQKHAASISKLGKGNLSGNMGLHSSVNGSQLAVQNTEETMEVGAYQGKKQSFPTNETSQLLNSKDGDTRSTTPEGVSDTKRGVTVGERDTNGLKQPNSTKPSSVDSAIIDFKLEELGPCQPNAADMYMYMQQAYASQYEYPVDPYFWFGTPLDLYSGQFPVPPISSYGSLLPDDYQSHDKEQMGMQGRDNRQGWKPSRDIGEDASSFAIGGGGNGQEVSAQPVPSFSPDGSPSESKADQENKSGVLPRHSYQCNLQDIVKPPRDKEHATSSTQGVTNDVVGTIEATSSAGGVPPYVSPVQQGTTRSDLTHVATKGTSQPSHQNEMGDSPFIFGLTSSSESEVNQAKGETIEDEIQQLPPTTNSLPAATPVSQKHFTLEPTSSVQKHDADQTMADKITSSQFQKVSLDKTTICPPNQVKSVKRTAAPSLQANIGLDSFDSVSERSLRKKRVRGYQQEGMERAGSGETSAEGKDSEGGWIHMAGKKKKRSHEQASQKRQQEPLVSKPSNPAEDEHIPSYFSLTHLLRKLSEMFPDESRLSLTSIILKVRANHRGQLDKVPFAVIISEAVSLLTASDSSEKRQDSAPAKKLEDSPEPVDQSSKSTQKGGLLTKLLKNLMEKFPNKERSDLIDGIIRVRNLHGNTLAGMTMAQVLFEVSQCLHNSITGHKQTDKENEDRDCCTVCLAPLKATQLVRELECTHRFHDECIHLWFEKRERTCPVCRSHALLEDDFPRLH